MVVSQKWHQTLKLYGDGIVHGMGRKVKRGNMANIIYYIECRRREIMKKIGFMMMGVFLLCACSSFKVDVKEEITIEYGEEVSVENLTDQKDISIKELKGYDAKKIGEQTITVMFMNADGKEAEQEVTLEIKDTKAPEIKFKKEKVEITEGDKFDPASNIESIKDPVDGDIKKSDDKKITKNGYIITSEVDAKKVKNGYKVKITAYDANGNKAEKEYTVNVKTKPVEKPQASTSQPANSGGQAASAAPAPSNSQSGGSASGGNASKPQAQPQQCVSNGEFGAVGNSGRVFYSEAEMQAWANEQIYPFSGEAWKQGYAGYHAWTVYDNCGERNDVWTVEFY